MTDIFQPYHCDTVISQGASVFLSQVSAVCFVNTRDSVYQDLQLQLSSEIIKWQDGL